MGLKSVITLYYATIHINSQNLIYRNISESVSSSALSSRLLLSLLKFEKLMKIFKTGKSFGLRRLNKVISYFLNTYYIEKK